MKRCLSLLCFFAALATLPCLAQAGTPAGDGFDAWANREWLAATAIPPGKGNITVRTQMTAQTRDRITRLLQDRTAWPAGSAARKAADFYAALLQPQPAGADALQTLRPALAQIAALRNKAALAHVLGSGLRNDSDPAFNESSSALFGLWVQAGFHGEKKYQAHLVQGGLVLPGRDSYLAPGTAALRERYLAYIAALLKAAGLPDSERRAAAVLELESAIAAGHATPDDIADDHKTDNTWRRADFPRRAPGLDWPRFFAAAQLSRQPALIVWQPAAIKAEAALVAARPLAVWQDWLRLHLLDRYAALLPPAFADPAQVFHQAPMAGQDDTARRAYDSTNRCMADAVGRMYVTAYPAAATKKKVEEITANVIAAFDKRIDQWQWMAPATRTEAHRKLNKMVFVVGYPEHWQDYAGLQVAADDPLGNLARAAAWNYRQALRKLDQPVGRDGGWFMAPQVVGARSQPEQNTYILPAGLLQAPKFDPAASDAANYGAIGAIIGHEIVHFFDIAGAGAEFDARNNLRAWWQPADLDALAAASAPLVRQFGAYHPLPDLAIDGQVVLSESTADLGGLMAAFDAHRASLAARAGETDFIRRQDREFFLGFAHSWQGKATDATVRALTGKDSHPPERYRIATVRNLDAWYDAFGVLPGDALYLPPAERVRIW